MSGSSTAAGASRVDYIIPEVATNVMLMTVWALCLFAQWAVYAGNRGDRAHTALALGVTGILAIAYINAQAFVYADMGVEIADEYYGALFYADDRHDARARRRRSGATPSSPPSGPSAAACSETEVLSAHALYWYFIAAAYSAVWFVVYVTK